MKKLLALLAVTVCAITAQAGEFPDISITEVKALSESKKAVIIDVNGTESYQKGRIIQSNPCLREQAPGQMGGPPPPRPRRRRSAPHKDRSCRS
jgi:photosystem II stability/assembly factor-like uncharacterized protein